MNIFGGFSTKKLKPHLKMAVSRLQIASNKKSAIMKQQMREIAVMLSEDPPKEEKAKIRAEALIREDNAVEAYEILQLECELLAERIKLIESMKECPPDLLSCVATVMWATDRCDIPEFEVIRKQFRSKYGKEFEEKALNNVGGCLNERVVSKLSVQPPAGYLVQTYLEKICDQFDVDWKPTVAVSAESMADPMAAPVGYSVQVAPGTGLAGTEAAVTGQMNTDQEVSYVPETTKIDNSIPPIAPTGGTGGTNNNNGGTAMPFVPPPVAPSSNNNNDFGEVDIFVPAIPTAPSGDGGVNANTGDNDDDDNTKPSDDGDGGKTGGSSYADLASRFEALNK